MPRSKVISREVKDRTRRRDFADGSISLTFDVVARYTLECGHRQVRSHRHEGAASNVGARLKCKECSA